MEKPEAPEAPVAKQAEPSKEDLAAYDFMSLLPLFKKKTDELSNFQLKRVTMALMEYPLGGSMPHFSYHQERELYTMGTKIVDCKSILIKALMDMSAEQIDQLSNEMRKKEVNASLQGELHDSKPGEVQGEPVQSSNDGTGQELPGSSGDGESAGV